MKNTLVSIFARGSVLLILSATSLAQTASAPANRFGGIRWADKFPGTSPRDQINAAMADCGPDTGKAGDSCLVIIPPGMACGEPNQAPDNVMLWDFRGCAQSQGLRFNVSRGASGHVRSKMLLQDNFRIKPTEGPPPLSSATLYVYSLPDSPDKTKGTVAAINGSISIDSLTGDFVGNLIGIEGEAGATLTEGGPYQVRDIRGGTFNSSVGKGVRATDVTSLYAQAPAISSGGNIANAYSFRAEAPKVGTNSNLAGLFNGDVRIDTKLDVGGSLSLGGGAPISKMLLKHEALNFGTIQGSSCQEKSMAVEQAAAGGSASASPASSINQQNLFWSAWISSPGNVSVRLCNVSRSAVTPANVTWNVTVIQ